MLVCFLCLGSVPSVLWFLLSCLNDRRPLEANTEDHFLPPLPGCAVLKCTVHMDRQGFLEQAGAVERLLSPWSSRLRSVRMGPWPPNRSCQKGPPAASWDLREEANAKLSLTLQLKAIYLCSVFKAWLVFLISLISPPPATFRSEHQWYRPMKTVFV